ncbi:ACP S-malonyltransferase [Tumebacillus flagellatus]|uniref:[acyl-carrier-protein] S-malonyltransferase n=1 Tax=Tumebacillus flagellatus TaxID=1157490 RepID=A0A074LRR4_9BACL|nr:ACP S-malonyltransferase [Tumebacillus flagellatus]KEO83160.1 hypothetical protein EL26_11875 [Tumebacillus flagellatus]
MEKIALLFPGQGSQYIGMTQNFCNRHEIARRTVEEASDLLGYDLARLMHEGDVSELNRPEHLQPAILTASVTAFRVFQQELGVLPEFAAGHSLGEYAALTCSGGIAFADALQIVRVRGRLSAQVAALGHASMMIVRNVDAGEIEQACRELSQGDGFVRISCYNSERQAAVSGHLEEMRALEARVAELGGSVVHLPLSPPFHSSLMEEAAEELREELARHRFFPLRWPVLANVTAKPYPGREAIVDLLTAQIQQPVQWQRTLRYLLRAGVTQTVELGPKSVLTSLTARNVPSIGAFSYDQREDRKKLHALLEGSREQSLRPQFLGRCLAIAVSTPNANPNRDEYEAGVLQPYRRLEALQADLESSDRTPGDAELLDAFRLLQQILRTKRVPEEEQQEWFHLLREETGCYDLIPSGLQI